MESFQKSIKQWKIDYIDRIGTTTGASLRDAYERAFDIFGIVREYVAMPNFRSRYATPVVSAIFGAGSTNYGYLLQADGFIEGKIEDNIKTFGSNIASNKSILADISLTPDWEDMVEFFTDLFDNTNVIDPDTKSNLKNLGTGGFALVNTENLVNTGKTLSCGPAILFAPGTILVETADYIYNQLHRSEQGAHLVNLYYFSRKYPELKNEYLDSKNGQFMDFLSLQTDENTICSSLAIADDNVAKALCFF